jgi:hypothetical protein
LRDEAECSPFKERRKDMKYASWLLMALLVFTFSCGPTYKEGQRIDTAKMREIMKGETTRAGVIEKLGQPAKAENLPTGQEKLTYYYNSEAWDHWYNLPKLYNQNLQVILKDGVVENYIYTRETRNAPADVD